MTLTRAQLDLFSMLIEQTCAGHPSAGPQKILAAYRQLRPQLEALLPAECRGCRDGWPFEPWRPKRPGDIGPVIGVRWHRTPTGAQLPCPFSVESAPV